MNKRIAPFLGLGLLLCALVLGLLSYHPFGDRDLSSPHGTRVTLVSPNGDRDAGSSSGPLVSQNGDRD